MAEGPIPFSAVDRFARRYGIDDLDEFDRFASVIRAMDAESMAGRAAQSKRAADLRSKLEAEEAEQPKKPKPKPLAKSRGLGSPRS